MLTKLKESATKMFIEKKHILKQGNLSLSKQKLEQLVLLGDKNG
jgi:hypothetical protein